MCIINIDEYFRSGLLQILPLQRGEYITVAGKEGFITLPLTLLRLAVTYNVMRITSYNLQVHYYKCIGNIHSMRYYR